MRIFNKGFNFSQDGPGNRLVYHLQGCNLGCIWCSNPEGMAFDGGIKYTPDEILTECISCKPMFFSGGGVTFTGGEATMQFNELSEVLTYLQNNAIHTAIETNGTHEKLPALLPFINYLIMDFKHFDSNIHKEFTGLGNETIKANFEQISNSGRQLHIRIPLINNFNTAYPEKFAQYFSSHNTENTVFEFLPYHEYGKEKWQSKYKVTDGFIKKGTLEEFTGIFTEYGLNTIKT